MVARSKYEEDVHPGNHTSVWGSWWHDGQWGYACCHQTIKNAYCTGLVSGGVAGGGGREGDGRRGGA